jgi:protoporphyrinogen oxidase
MKIGIIGAGFAGLSLALELSKDPTAEIEVLEANPGAGGLALGFGLPHWEWMLEEHYHHAFDTDIALKKFVADLGLSKELIYKRAKSSTWYKGKLYQVDSASSLLGFKQLPLIDRLRTGVVLAFLKVWPFGQILESQRALEFLRKCMGQTACQVLWEPLFAKKFGRFAEEVNLAWFWGRIHPRTARLGYFKGSFKRLADQAVTHLQAKGVKFHFQTAVTQLMKQDDALVALVRQVGETPVRSLPYDVVICTLPAPLFSQMIRLPELEHDHLQGLAAMTLVLRLRKKLLTDGTYWLNINDKKWPFLAVVEHDNLVSSRHYADESIVYVGRYLEASDPDFMQTTEQVLARYTPYLDKLQKNWHKNLIKAELFKAPFAQPIVGKNHSQRLPQWQTSVPGLYWVSMQHIYPFDRGINYAISSAAQLGKHVRINSSRHG